MEVIVYPHQKVVRIKYEEDKEYKEIVAALAAVPSNKKIWIWRKYRK